MPDWLEDRSPKLARMFDHIVEDCQNRDKGDWDLPSDVSSCYEYAMGRVKDEPEFKKALTMKTKNKKNRLKAHRHIPVNPVIKRQLTRRKGQSSQSSPDYYGFGLSTLSNIKKDLISLETDIMISLEELDDLRYLDLTNSSQEMEGVPKIIEAKRALETVQKNIAASINTLDLAKRAFRGESQGDV